MAFNRQEVQDTRRKTSNAEQIEHLARQDVRTLSKTKLLAYRQCLKRLWLEIHHPELYKEPASTQASFVTGHRVGDIARQIYDPKGEGVLLDPHTDGFNISLTQTQSLLQAGKPVFEAGFRTEGALAFADAMLPVKKNGKRAWRMVEVKSTTSVKDYHHDDVAIQSLIARRSGVPLAAIAVAHINNEWVYPGGGNYDGLLIEKDLTEEALARAGEARDWIAQAREVAARHKEPAITTGPHCHTPYECGFSAYCRSQEPQTEYPIAWLPRISWRSQLNSYISRGGITDLRDVPDTLLNKLQQRVKTATLSDKPYFDQKGAAEKLAPYPLPAYFMDFETIQFAVPIWKGTRPYQKIPFQFSVHHLSRTGSLQHKAFLDLTGKDPSKAFAKALITACGERGPIFVYNAGFEKGRIKELSERFPRMAEALLGLNARVVDLLPIVQRHYYHPSQEGSWSIKKVLPALRSDLGYGDLDGVQNGGMAMDAYVEALSPQTSTTRKTEIERQLLEYCALDTYAMIRIWATFTDSGKTMQHKGSSVR